MLRGLLLIFAVFWLFFFTLLMVSRARAAVAARAKGGKEYGKHEQALILGMRGAGEFWIS